MAQLKSTVISGDLRVTDNLYTNVAQLSILRAPSTSGGTDYGIGTAGQILKTGANGIYWAADSQGVTSITITATSPISINASTAITSSGTRTISLADGYGDTKNPYGTKTANLVLAGPASGSAAAPSFRALETADIPNLNASKINDGVFDTARIPTGISITGNATTATTASKLSNTSAIGNTDRPVYFTSGGVPSQTTYRMAGTNTAATTAVAITNNLDTGIWYVNGTNSTDLYSQSDGAAYVNKYDNSWLHEIYGDYRTGQIAIRGKKNGTWQSWRKVIDSGNFTSYLNDGIASNSTTLAATANSALVASKKTASSNNNTATLFLIGASSQSSTGIDTYSSTYLYETAGALNAKSYAINAGTNSTKITLEWNDTSKTLDFIFN